MAAIEGGNRPTLSLADVLLVAFAFRVPLDEFFHGEGEVRLADHLTPVPRRWARAIAQGDYPAIEYRHVSEWDDAEAEQQAIRRWMNPPDPDTAATEADHLLARRLHIDPDGVIAAAMRLWGRTLTEERNARVADLGEMTTSERHAVRGHITRELSQQIADQLPTTTGAPADDRRGEHVSDPDTADPSDDTTDHRPRVHTRHSGTSATKGTVDG